MAGVVTKSQGKESIVKTLTRRSLLQKTPVSAAALSLLPAMPALAAIHHSPKAAAQLSTKSAGPMVVHVNNVATGEMTLLVGTRAIVLRDPRIVARLLEATREGGA
jgi:hypothetical protein